MEAYTLLKPISILLGILYLSGCQTPVVTEVQTPAPVALSPTAPIPDGVVITPYDYPDIQRKKVAN